MKVLAVIFMLLSATAMKAADPADTLRLTVEEALEIALSENLNIKIAGAELERIDYLKQENWYAL